MHGTTIVAVCRDGMTAVAGDGQVTLGNNMIAKRKAHKVRRIHHGRVIVGFAGAVADALALFEKFEQQLEAGRGNLHRAAVMLAKEWRTDRVLRRLDATLIAAASDGLLLISGSGEVLEPDDGVLAVGSGGSIAMAAAQALLRHTDMAADQIASAAMEIAADLCVYTNHEIVIETLNGGEPGCGN